MVGSERIGIDDFRALVRRAGLDLTAEELESLRPMYELIANQTTSLHDMDLGAEDLAVVFSPNLHTCRQVEEVQK